jgi:hypothetical protein
MRDRLPQCMSFHVDIMVRPGRVSAVCIVFLYI